MPMNGIGAGVDANFGFYDSNTGAVINFGSVQAFDIKHKKHDLVDRPYNAPPIHAYVDDGYSGSITVLRNGAQLEDLQIQLTRLFNAGGVVKSGYLNLIMNNPDGTVSKRQYTKCVFFLTDMGSISREKTISQTIELMATELVNLT